MWSTAQSGNVVGCVIAPPSFRRATMGMHLSLSEMLNVRVEAPPWAP